MATYTQAGLLMVPDSNTTCGNYQFVFGQQGGNFTANNPQYALGLAAQQLGAAAQLQMDKAVAEAIVAPPARYPVIDMGTTDLRMSPTGPDGAPTKSPEDDITAPHQTQLRHDFSDPYCQARRWATGRIAYCKRCGSMDDTLGHCPGDMPGWQRFKDATIAEVMKVRGQLVSARPPEKLVQGRWEPSESGLGGMGCRMVHNDRVR